MRSQFRFTVIALGIIAGLAVFPAGLSAGTTGTLIGIVTDSQGSALPGVLVTVSSRSLQGNRTATTTSAGEYNIPLLPPGEYRVEFAISGFERVARERVVISLDQTTKVSVSLALAAVTEEVTVRGDAVVIDPTQTNTQINFKEDHLKYASIGQANRTYQSVMQSAGGVGGGANPNVFGANLGQNAYLLDGVNTTDPVTHTFGSNLAFDAIQEIAFQTGGFEAEYGKAVGGIVNVITKSGGNQFSGTLDGRYSTEKFTEQGERFQPFPAGTTATTCARNLGEFDPATGTCTALRYNKDFQDFQNLKYAGTLGGPILRDRLWFFGAAERVDNKNQPPNTRGFLPGRRDFVGWNLFGKLTANPFDNQSLAFKYTNNFADIPYAQNNSTTTPDAGRLQKQGGYIYNLSWDAVLTPQWVVNVQGNINNTYLSSEPQSGDRLTTGVIDRSSGISSVNYSNFQTGKRKRTEALGSTTYYVEAFGSHAFKLGTDLEWTKFPNENNPTGTPFDASLCSPDFGQPEGAVCGAIDRPSNGNPSRYDVITILPKETPEARGMAFFAQDEWRPIPQFTAKIGLRYDQSTFYRAGGDRVKSLTRFQPRIGFAWDLFNNSSTVVRAQAGEFMDDNALTLPSFLSKSGSVTSIFSWSNSRQQYVFAGAIGGPTGNIIDPALRPTYSQELNVGVTQRVVQNTSLEVTGVYRKTKNIYEDSCAFDNCAVDGTFWLTNSPDGMDNALRSQYKGLIFKVESRPSQRINLFLIYTLSESKGSIEYTQNAGTDFDVFPDHFVNRFGYLSDDARHRVKLSGFAKLPWEFIFSTNIYWDSGVPYNVTSTNAPNAGYGEVFLEPRGSRRLPHYYQWDLQLQKDFVFGPLRFGLIGSVFNVLDTEIELTRDGSVGLGTVENPTNARFNFPTSWQRPRRYEAGVRVEF
ncbi:MAG TPA: TonB-dependent receptor [Thermoanaerobaculia bacterium]|nr:TonB-dependent receptor [Thermoanaerobaculia bacterium]